MKKSVRAITRQSGSGLGRVATKYAQVSQTQTLRAMWMRPRWITDQGSAPAYSRPAVKARVTTCARWQCWSVSMPRDVKTGQGRSREEPAAARPRLRSGMPTSRIPGRECRLPPGQWRAHQGRPTHRQVRLPQRLRRLPVLPPGRPLPTDPPVRVLGRELPPGPETRPPERAARPEPAG